MVADAYAMSRRFEGFLIRAVSRSVTTVLLALCATSPAYAQARMDSVAVLRAAAVAMLARLPNGLILLDPGVAFPGHQSKGFRKHRSAEDPMHDSTTLAALRPLFGGRIARTEDVFTCDADTPRSCRLRQGTGVMAFGRPIIEGDHATVAIYWTGESGFARMPIVHSDETVVLERDKSGWRVVEIQLDRIT